MFDFLPTKMEKMKQLQSHGSGVVLYYRTEFAWRHQIIWYALCSLDRRCIAPVGHIQKCSFNGQPYTRFANCHRYDQSVLNTLLANDYQFDDNITYSSVRILTAERWGDEKKEKAVEICNGP